MILNPDLVYMYSDLHLNLNLIYVIVVECDLGYSFNQKYDDFFRLSKGFSVQF